MRIAIIGTGIAGLSAAWHLGPRHQLTLFDRLPDLGMAAHGVDLAGHSAIHRADVPLRVIYPAYYPELMALYSDAGISTVAVDYSGSFSYIHGTTYFRYHNAKLGGLALPYPWGRVNFGPMAMKIALETLRFYRQAPRDLASGRLAQMTFQDYCELRKFGDAFRDLFVLPMFAAIGTCQYKQVLQSAADVVVSYLTGGVLFQSVRRTRQDARHVVSRLASRADKLNLGTAVARVRCEGDEVVLTDQTGEVCRFDHVVFATHAHQALSLLDNATASEGSALSSFDYERSRVVVHHDRRLAPKHRRDWAPVNLIVDPEQPAPMASIWLNRVLPLDVAERAVFQTWNPLIEPASDTLLSEHEFDRPLSNFRSQAGLEKLTALHAESGRRMWFCGSYAASGVPLLESAASSARNISDLLDKNQTP